MGVVATVRAEMVRPRPHGGLTGRAVLVVTVALGFVVLSGCGGLPGRETRGELDPDERDCGADGDERSTALR